MKETHPNPTKGDKQEVRQEMVLTYPPRLEGVVKNRGTKPIRKHKKARSTPQRMRKSQGYSDRQRKNYHLKSKKH